MFLCAWGLSSPPTGVDNNVIPSQNEEHFIISQHDTVNPIEIITDWTFHASKTNNKGATQGYNEEGRHNNNSHWYGGELVEFNERNMLLA